MRVTAQNIRKVFGATVSSVIVVGIVIYIVDATMRNYITNIALDLMESTEQWLSTTLLDQSDGIAKHWMDRMPSQFGGSCINADQVLNRFCMP